MGNRYHLRPYNESGVAISADARNFRHVITLIYPCVAVWHHFDEGVKSILYRSRGGGACWLQAVAALLRIIFRLLGEGSS